MKYKKKRKQNTRRKKKEVPKPGNLGSGCLGGISRTQMGSDIFLEYIFKYIYI
jgi:hypothetical protein